MYKTIIIKNNIDTCIQEITANIDNLVKDGSIFCIVKTQYKDGIVDKDFMDLIEYGISLELYYINTIVIPDNTDMLDNVLYCVWFTKDKKSYYFNKDFIREKSIWKDVEWGKREKNYNSKGKEKNQFGKMSNGENEKKTIIPKEKTLVMFGFLQKMMEKQILQITSY